MTPYDSTVGSLMYAMVCTRLDIAHSVGVVSRFLANPGKQHWQAVKWIFSYLKGTSNYCLCFRNHNSKLQGYTNANIVGYLDNKKLGKIHTEENQTNMLTKTLPRDTKEICRILASVIQR